MNTAFQRIALVGRHTDERVAGPMSAIAGLLAEHDVDVIADDEMTLDLKVTRYPAAELAGRADLIIAIGGDGTMLYAARLANESDVPLLGINRGRLGFLADVTPDEMIKSIGHVLAGNFTRDSRLQLQATLIGPDGAESSSIALNDVVLQRRETGRMVDFKTSIAGRYVNTHAGDGLIIATPTGSTAYALSCGGPIIEPRLNAVVIAPICPHTLTDRPIVIPAEQRIEVRLLERDDTKAEITVDGHSMGDIRPEDRLLIVAAKHRMTLIHPPGHDFYSILRSKLYWGRDSRVRHPEEH